MPAARPRRAARIRSALTAAAPICVAALVALTACTSGATHPRVSAAGDGMSSATPAASEPLPAPTSAARSSTSQQAPTTRHSSRPAPRASTSSAPHPAVERALPLHLPTGSATRVVTVVASSTHGTTATLQAWQKSGDGWKQVGSAVTAQVGIAGLTTHPSERVSATPIGSFTLTRAFGYGANPGTALPYVRTTPADWWISQTPNPLYNTMQHCAHNCPFRLGSPNEHLYKTRPFYEYAVVIDYNTANAGRVVQGAGSAFFLHVTNGKATAGCVAIPRSRLVSIMKWLTPSAHPRILIGIG